MDTVIGWQTTGVFTIAERSRTVGAQAAAPAARPRIRPTVVIFVIGLAPSRIPVARKGRSHDRPFADQDDPARSARRAVFPVITARAAIIVVITRGALVIILAAVGALLTVLFGAAHRTGGAADGRANRCACAGRAAADIVADHRAREGAEGGAA